MMTYPPPPRPRPSQRRRPHASSDGSPFWLAREPAPSLPVATPCSFAPISGSPHPPRPREEHHDRSAPYLSGSRSTCTEGARRVSCREGEKACGSSGCASVRVTIAVLGGEDPVRPDVHESVARQRSRSRRSIRTYVDIQSPNDHDYVRHSFGSEFEFR